MTYEIARRLVARGNSVEWFSASFPGAPTEEEIDGIRFVRAGHQWSVHFHAYRSYRNSLHDRFDLVIDEVNTMPFFTPLWAGIPTFMLIFQLAREVWWYESPFPLSAIGYAVEPLYLKTYRNTPVLTISNSTSKDLRRLGFRNAITVVPIGIEQFQLQAAMKADVPTFLYVGRIAPSKRIDHMLHALARFRGVSGSGRLLVVGSGSARYQRKLDGLARHLKISDAVRFLGRVTPWEKVRLMSEAHALLMTSVREGWGLVVTEANYCGTPALVYDVAGLRDSVRNDTTGLVVGQNPVDLAAAMLKLISDTALYQRLATGAREWAGTFSFDNAADCVSDALDRQVSA